MAEVGRVYRDIVTSAATLLEDGSILTEAPHHAVLFHNILLRLKTWGYETEIESNSAISEDARTRILVRLRTISSAIHTLKSLSDINAINKFLRTVTDQLDRLDEIEDELCLLNPPLAGNESVLDSPWSINDFKQTANNLVDSSELSTFGLTANTVVRPKSNKDASFESLVVRRSSQLKHEVASSDTNIDIKSVEPKNASREILRADNPSPGIGVPSNSRSLKDSGNDVAFHDNVDLGDEIAEVMQEHKIGLPETGESNYLPDADRERLVTPSRIRQTLERQTLAPLPAELILWIETKASKTFAVTILVISESKPRLEAMYAFYRHGFSDASLPVKDLGKTCTYVRDSSKRNSCSDQCDQHTPQECMAIHARPLDCFHHSVWSVGKFRAFYETQWGLLLQTFYVENLEGLPILDSIEAERILPFLPGNEARDITTGFFATIQPARMLQGFQDTIRKLGHPTIDIAIKTLYPVNEKDIDIENEWRREAAAHAGLDRLNRDHLVQAIAAYKYRGQYCMIFEWANGGNLRSYWNTTLYGGLTPDLILEHLSQLRGIASALETMHNTSQAGGRRRRESITSNHSGNMRFSASDKSINIELPELHVEDFDGSNIAQHTWWVSHEEYYPQSWRHGDVNPDNILRFTTETSGLGKLKLADLGTTKRSFLGTENCTTRSSSAWRTKAYEPPDLYLDHTRSMSTLFDVWSLGCVFFESIVWILYGKSWLESFLDTTNFVDREDTPFWTRSGPSSAETSLTLLACMKHMFEQDPECNGRVPSAMRDLLNLVQFKMLVVDLPVRTDTLTPGKRANIANILNDLDSILEKSRNHGYLFTGHDRSNLRPLPDPLRIIPPTLSEDLEASPTGNPISSLSLYQYPNEDSFSLH